MTLERAQAVATHVTAARKKSSCEIGNVTVVGRYGFMDIKTNIVNPLNMAEWFVGSSAFMCMTSFYSAGVWRVSFLESEYGSSDD